MEPLHWGGIQRRSGIVDRVLNRQEPININNQTDSFNLCCFGKIEWLECIEEVKKIVTFPTRKRSRPKHPRALSSSFSLSFPPLSSDFILTDSRLSPLDLFFDSGGSVFFREERREKANSNSITIFSPPLSSSRQRVSVANPSSGSSLGHPRLAFSFLPGVILFAGIFSSSFILLASSGFWLSFVVCCAHRAIHPHRLPPAFSDSPRLLD